MTTSGPRAGSPGADELLGRLYRQLTEQQAAWFSAGYDIAAGLDRYAAWLRAHATEAPAAAEPLQAGALWAGQASVGETGRTTATPGTGEALIAGPPGRESAATQSPAAEARPDEDAERVVTELYAAHYQALVRLAALLVRDVAVAEEIVQDAFIAMHCSWRRLADRDRALSYLRQSVVNRSRSVPRHRVVGVKIEPVLAAATADASEQVISELERSAVVSALRSLPARQREALVLRYYAGLSEAQTASAMGISPAAVKNHTAQALSSLRAKLRDDHD
jgi:RNA polymerase sigma-70 factor (sigma-E family)